jgi:hypothetical protein
MRKQAALISSGAISVSFPREWGKPWKSSVILTDFRIENRIQVIRIESKALKRFTSKLGHHWMVNWEVIVAHFKLTSHYSSRETEENWEKFQPKLIVSGMTSESEMCRIKSSCANQTTTPHHTTPHNSVHIICEESYHTFTTCGYVSVGIFVLLNGIDTEL